MNTLQLIAKKIGFRFNCWTCTLLIFGAGLLAILGASSSADASDCPPVKPCQLMERGYQGCSKNKADECSRFIRHFAELAAYKCNKTTELEAETPSVPAVQLCDAHKDFTLARYAELLASLNTPEARKFFSSEKFRKALDKTSVAEEYVDRSKESEVAPKKLIDKQL